ncbi:unnamed protein product [Durusdinium trenchii]|uniref:Large ribosomal subunit protein mL49 n=1 Tax=Durusdinium trenchii TaxID=1381693 RepID=A0ABP0HGS2_9DINO
MLACKRWPPGLKPFCRGVCERKYRKKEGVDTKTLPFLVHRTPSGNLPVYVEPTQKGEKFTRIRRVFGDAEHLAQEVSRICNSSARVGRAARKTVEAPLFFLFLCDTLILPQ